MFSNTVFSASAGHSTPKSDQLTIEKIRELSSEGNELIVVSGTMSCDNTKLFCHDQVDLSFSRKTIKLHKPSDIENKLYKDIGSSEDTTIIVLLHKYYTDPNILPPENNWASIGSGFHFEPRKKLPLLSSIKRSVVDKDDYLNYLRSRFVNPEPLHNLDIYNSNFHISYFTVKANSVENDS